MSITSYKSEPRKYLILYSFCWTAQLFIFLHSTVYKYILFNIWLQSQGANHLKYTFFLKRFTLWKTTAGLSWGVFKKLLHSLIGRNRWSLDLVVVPVHPQRSCSPWNGSSFMAKYLCRLANLEKRAHLASWIRQPNYHLGKPLPGSPSRKVLTSKGRRNSWWTY